MKIWTLLHILLISEIFDVCRPLGHCKNSLSAYFSTPAVGLQIYASKNASVTSPHKYIPIRLWTESICGKLDNLVNWAVSNCGCIGSFKLYSLQCFATTPSAVTSICRRVPLRNHTTVSDSYSSCTVTLRNSSYHILRVPVWNPPPHWSWSWIVLFGCTVELDMYRSMSLLQKLENLVLQITLSCCRNHWKHFWKWQQRFCKQKLQ